MCLIFLVFIKIGEQPSKNNYMNSELNKIEKYLLHRDSLNTQISKVTVAWHLDHSLKVINGICDSLQKSKPEIFKRKFNMARIFSFTFGFIPRGRAQSPKSVMPPDTIKTEDIVSQLMTARNKLIGLEALNEKSNFKHPVFDQLDKKQTKRFIEIHTRHHLKIIKDILNE